uniref:Movement protein n=1 Tax=Haemonchus placei TaxID=6290 RepID=A0A0N4WAE3_HAEPC
LSNESVVTPQVTQVRISSDLGMKQRGFSESLVLPSKRQPTFASAL